MSKIDSELGHYRYRTDLTISDLADAAGGLLAGVQQSRYKVRALPDVRTLRYYLREGVLDPPLTYDGGWARFGYRHLLQVVVTKRLQAEYLALRKIKEMT